MEYTKLDNVCLWLGRCPLVKMIILPKTMYRLNAVFVKISKVCFTEIGKTILKFIGDLKGPWIAETTLKKKNKVGDLGHLHFKTYYKAGKIKTVQYWHNDRCINQWRRIESPKINTCLYGQIIFDKSAKTTHGKRRISCKQMMLEHLPYTKYKN